jgi:hypothetical protein
MAPVVSVTHRGRAQGAFEYILLLVGILLVVVVVVGMLRFGVLPGVNSSLQAGMQQFLQAVQFGQTTVTGFSYSGCSGSQCNGASINFGQSLVPGQTVVTIYSSPWVFNGSVDKNPNMTFSADNTSVSVDVYAKYGEKIDSGQTHSYNVFYNGSYFISDTTVTATPTPSAGATASPSPSAGPSPSPSPSPSPGPTPTPPPDSPPNASLYTPSNGAMVNPGSISFYFTPTDDRGFSSARLWGNFTGMGFVPLDLNQSPVENNTLNYITRSVTPGTYIWSIRVCDNTGQCVTAPNYTLVVPYVISFCSYNITNPGLYVVNQTLISNGVATCIKFEYGASNIVLDCQNRLLTSSPVGGTGIFLSDSNTNNVIKNCVVQSFTTGISLLRSTGNIINYSQSSNNVGGTGIGLKLDTSNNNIIANSLFSGNAGGGPCNYCTGYAAYAMYVTSSNNNVFSNCSFVSTQGGSGSSYGGQNYPGGAAYGAYLYQSNNNTFTSVNASGNKGGNGAGGNTGGAGYGAYIQQSTDNAVINSNVSYNRGADASGSAYGIYLYSSNNTMIRNNNLSVNMNASGGGSVGAIYITYYSYANNVTNNWVCGNSVIAYDLWTNAVQTAGSDNTCRLNRCRHDTTATLHLCVPDAGPGDLNCTNTCP